MKCATVSLAPLLYPMYPAIIALAVYAIVILIIHVDATPRANGDMICMYVLASTFHTTILIIFRTMGGSRSDKVSGGDEVGGGDEVDEVGGGDEVDEVGEVSGGDKVDVSTTVCAGASVFTQSVAYSVWGTVALARTTDCEYCTDHKLVIVAIMYQIVAYAISLYAVVAIIFALAQKT